MRRHLFLSFLILFLGMETYAQIPANPSIVTVSGYRVLVQKRLPNNSLTAATPYVIQGTGWNPVDAGFNQPPQWAARYAQDIPLIAEMNANTIRTWSSFPTDATGIAMLDLCYQNGIMVIMTVNDTDYTTTVNYFKNHPAILMWMVGNEWNYNRFYGKYATLAACVTAINNAANGIKGLDANHPVATCFGDPSGVSGYIASVNAVDVWGFNIYRDNTAGTYGFGTTMFNDYKAVSSKPMFISEYGSDAWNNNTGSEDQAAQARSFKTYWRQTTNNLSARDVNKVCVGASLMTWNDEWWKSGTPSVQSTGGFGLAVAPDGYANEEYWGIVRMDRSRRQIFYTMQSNFVQSTFSKTHITFSPSSSMSVGKLAIKIGTTGTATAPVVKTVNPMNVTNTLTVVTLSSTNFAATNLVTLASVNGSYALIFSASINGTNVTSFSGFVIDTLVPDQPAGGYAYPSDAGLVLEWEASSDNANGSGVSSYKIFRSTDGVNFTLLTTTSSLKYVDTTATVGTLYTYKISAVDMAGNESTLSTAFQGRQTQNLITAYPSPGRVGQNITIGINLPETVKVNLSINDLSGRKVAQIVKNEIYNKGWTSFVWDGKDLHGNTVKRGVYYCYLTRGTEEPSIIKIILRE